MKTQKITQKITDKNGIDYLLEKPKEGQMCQTKIKGEEGYHGKSKYTNGYFETYEDKGNRMVITRWKADLWLPTDFEVVKNLGIANVSNQRELLLAFAGWLYGNLDKEVEERIVDDYLNSK